MTMDIVDPVSPKPLASSAVRACIDCDIAPFGRIEIIAFATMLVSPLSTGAFAKNVKKCNNVAKIHAIFGLCRNAHITRLNENKDIPYKTKYKNSNINELFLNKNIVNNTETDSEIIKQMEK